MNSFPKCPYLNFFFWGEGGGQGWDGGAEVSELFHKASKSNTIYLGGGGLGRRWRWRERGLV